MKEQNNMITGGPQQNIYWRKSVFVCLFCLFVFVFPILLWNSLTWVTIFFLFFSYSIKYFDTGSALFKNHLLIWSWKEVSLWEQRGSDTTRSLYWILLQKSESFGDYMKNASWWWTFCVCVCVWVLQLIILVKPIFILKLFSIHLLITISGLSLVSIKSSLL